jgi:hypothetical protein
MNYIKRLEKENKEMAEVLSELRLHLHTDKFMWPNDYINIKDVLNRIEPIWPLYNKSED